MMVSIMTIIPPLSPMMETIMPPRPTLSDVARQAGVGPATVDRVLNARAYVRPETAERVFEAARAIGYHGTRLLQRRLEAAAPHYRVGFLLQRPEQPFFQGLERGLRDACAAATSARLTPEVAFLRSQSSTDIVAGLRALSRKAQAIAMVVTDHPSVTATVAELHAAGIPVFALLSDAAMSARRGYLGIDNLKAGRSSGWMMARCVPAPGKVAIFVGSHRFHGHEMREVGYRSYLRETAPELEIIDTQVNLEDLSLAHEAVLDLLRRHRDLKGIYLAGGGTEGAIAALREESAPGQVALVCNELTETTRAGLADGYVSAVISTPIPALARATTAEMIAALSGSRPPEAQTVLPFEIYISENI
jgi:LacI family transcriptional regulator